MKDMKEYLVKGVLLALGVVAFAALLSVMRSPGSSVIIVGSDGEAKVVQGGGSEGILGAVDSALATRFTDIIVENEIQVDGAATITGALTQTGALTVVGETNLDTLVHGGSTAAAATTTNFDIQLTAAQVCDNSLLTLVGTTTGTPGTLTLPTSAALIADCLPTAGDQKRITFRGPLTAAEGGYTATASTTIELQEMEGATVVVTGTEFMVMDLMNQDGTTTTVTVTITQVAD